MRFRIGSVLLLLLSGCATSVPGQKEKAQVAPVSPLVVPKPLTVPVPVGLNPPVPLGVVPEELPSPPPHAASERNREPAPALTAERRPECIPQRVPHLGGDALHDRCADNVPQNEFPGFDVRVNGKHFDALQLAPRVLWEVKTDNFDTYTAALRRMVIDRQVPELQRERELARACGFDFRVGVRSAAHRTELLRQDRFLHITVMDWC
jgi:hypothetical protein